MTVRQRAMDRQPLAGHRMPALEQNAQAFDQLGRPVREVEQGALLDLAVLAVALAQQHRGWRITIGHVLDVHARTKPQDYGLVNPKNACLHGYKIGPKTLIALTRLAFPR